ncbi:MAG: LPXTG cell wall anchor domain-containing protein [Aquificae bacterium]|nr:LPXTG cell wall anchor domain-containing protein [Aquificota bacterium]
MMGDGINSAEKIGNKTLEQCDPYSAFGVFCNANGLVEGFLIIAGVLVMVAGAVFFVKKNQEANREKHREKYGKYLQ